MHARLGRLQLAPEQLDDGLREWERNQLPAYREQPGYRGFTVLADRSTGELVGISFWESEADLQASESVARDSQAETLRAGGGSQEPERTGWEVVHDEKA